MKVTCCYCFVFTLLFSSNVQAEKTQNTQASKKTRVEFFADSASYSNILPIKQLIEDDWQQAPKHSASDGFTQNEMGARVYWNNFSFSASHRYDYFIFSNSDTANAFYLDRSDQPLNSQEKYNIDLKLFHQRSNGIRLGYKFVFDNFSSEIRLGYWDLSATRESYLTGTLSSDLNGKINALADLKEFYTDKNLLHRKNTNDWDTDGTGITLDIHLAWQPNDSISLYADLKDVYSDFSLDNSGYSEGTFDTHGTFVNSVGGKAYLPIYRGKELESKHQFELPEQVDLIGLYHNTAQLSYLARYKRQGEQNFYYLGVEVQHENSSTRLSLDVENVTPEIQYKNNWFTLLFAIDDLRLERALQLNLGLSLNYRF
jgi:hypothetical protein